MNNDKIQVRRQEWFGVPIWDCVLNYNTAELEKYCLSVKDDTFKRHPMATSIQGGWQSKDYWKSNCDNIQIQNLLLDVENLCKNIFDLMEIKSWYKLKMLNYWFNINNREGYNKRHTHPGSFFSAVFYVKAPTNCGDIVFLRPDSLVDYWLRTYFKENDVFYSHSTYTPKENSLIIFPSWLMHGVEPNQTDENRISIAFNIGVQDLSLENGFYDNIQKD